MVVKESPVLNPRSLENCIIPPDEKPEDPFFSNTGRGMMEEVYYLSSQLNLGNLFKFLLEKSQSVEPYDLTAAHRCAARLCLSALHQGEPMDDTSKTLQVLKYFRIFSVADL